ncbi:MAG: lactonase family protein [Bacteroidaceae bacterium]|nr:lactonase family protein [Bacteroidaceae bacterium]
MILSHVMSALFLLIGSYSDSDAEGICVYSFDPQTARSTYVSGVSGISNPSFLCLSSNGKRVYAVGEDEGTTSTANYLKFNPRKGTLRLVNSRPTQGGAPCNITLTPNERMVVTANYFGGSVTAFPLDRRGRLRKGNHYRFDGHSVDPKRQTRPYLHAVYFTPDGSEMWCNDLGTDQIHAFPLQANGMPLIDAAHQADHFLKAGLGPRHLCFSSAGRLAYLLGELSGEVCTLDYSEPSHIRVVQTLRADSLNAGGSADIHISPDGRYVYTSHRLQGDGISILRVRADGTLAKVGYQPTAAHPRNFALTPDGRYLLVACRDADVVEIYRRDATTGLLSDTHERIHTSRPVCLQFVAR